jgi:orotate phosphoribosyltransferase
MQYPKYAEMLCKEMAKMFADEKVELVAGPAMGGIVMAYEVARQLGCRTIFAEKDNGKMVFRRGFYVKPGERVLLVEDAISTGGSVNEVAETVAQAGGNIVGIAALVDRTGGKVSFGVPFKALLSLEIESFAPPECPQCKAGVEVTLPKSIQI